MRSKLKKIIEVGKYFRATPIRDPDYFIGRASELDLLCSAIVLPGKHAVIYGDRGVGKNSLVYRAAKEISASEKYMFSEHMCTYKNEYPDIFSTLLDNAKIEVRLSDCKRKTTKSKSGILKFLIATIAGNTITEEEDNYKTITTNNINPNMISNLFSNKKWLFFIDEFDRLTSKAAKILIAETVKSLSNLDSKSKIIISGVSDNSIELIGDHESLKKNLTTIHLPRMSDKELETIVVNGAEKLKLKFIGKIINKIVSISDGFPFYTHLLAEKLAIDALENERSEITNDNLMEVLNKVILSIPDDVRNLLKRATEDPTYGMRDSDMDSIADTFRGVSFPGKFRELILFGFSLFSSFENQNISYIVNFIKNTIKNNNLTFLRAFENINEKSVEDALHEICVLSKILKESYGVRYELCNPFVKVFVRLKAMETLGLKDD